MLDFKSRSLKQVNSRKNISVKGSHLTYGITLERDTVIKFKFIPLKLVNGK